MKEEKKKGQRKKPEKYFSDAWRYLKKGGSQGVRGMGNILLGLGLYLLGFMVWLTEQAPKSKGERKALKTSSRLDADISEFPEFFGGTNMKEKTPKEKEPPIKDKKKKAKKASPEKDYFKESVDWDIKPDKYLKEE